LRAAFGWSGFAAEGLVVAVGVEGEFAEDLACRAVDDDDVEVVDQEPDEGAGVFCAEADVVQPAASAQGDFASGAVCRLGAPRWA
jgi:hypothetical protein